ncbi:hypothetical protein [Anaerolinea thermophila]|uniref:hypothetical protein n=2 Tax=Anaerolinea TaxID=233189 RepID=UPI0026E9D3B9|nr:hypothetical protein [Anaerolinea thermophila]
MLKSKRVPTYIGETLLTPPPVEPIGGYVPMLRETYYKIQHYDAMPPFFMSIVSGADHWLFVASTGGVTAGRAHADQALFPYYTEDKITENSENTGPKTILRVTRGAQTWLWEPFSVRQQGQYHVERNLYKNIPGTALVFEEINHSLELVFRYAWRTSDRFGFVKTAWLRNASHFQTPCEVELLDGLQNILPANVSASVQNIFSCLLDAYKRSELDEETNLGLFTLNSRLTDLAEPSESLAANTVFQVGLNPLGFLLSSNQLDAFRFGGQIEPEKEVRGERGAYFVHAHVRLQAGEEINWYQVADVHLDHAALARLRDFLRLPFEEQKQAIEQDIDFTTFNLQKFVASADGLQISESGLATTHHYANVLFNIMRGGVFARSYWIEKADLMDFVHIHQHNLTETYAEFFAALPDNIHLSDLYARVAELDAPDLRRLIHTYLPLTFSRRHGDPSRPWNRFFINIKKRDGSLRLDYEGNWRDIFQNWEALAYSYPQYIEAMLNTFLCATTADGYNPYRINRAGLDWEVPEEGNPWANIGYWSDHQIIYLQKLMEASEAFYPGAIRERLNQPFLSYANVPYRIKPYSELQKDPYNTIVFDHALHRRIEQEVKQRGSDARLLCDSEGNVVHASFTEKLLTLLLAKLVNFVPEGGIWMNTQRPEWNDANNALVGRGLSVVTLGYLRRFLAFFRQLIQHESGAFTLHSEVKDLLDAIAAVLKQFHPVLEGTFTPEQRRAMMDALGESGSEYRWRLYHHGFSGALSQLSASELQAFLAMAQEYVDHSLRANRRPDFLYHSYNLLRLEPGRAYVDRLYEMLEGQVSILSSGLLSGEESLKLLQSLRNSALYRADQHTYILYPDRVLPSFLKKNTLVPEQVSHLKLPALLVENQDTTLFTRDIHGLYHFASDLRNVKDVRKALEALKRHPAYAQLVEEEGEAIQHLFETTFRHAEFTGRSGTFFAYEGLGSVYWHMVSKLLLAVQETALRCQHEETAEGLRAAYRDIRAGLGYHKSPAEYGAFPTDPYSHTPKGRGARQPGMTGTVKEEILTRQAEVGVQFAEGRLVFNPFLLDTDELLLSPRTFTYLDVSGEQQTLHLPAGSLTSFVCQTPVTVQLGERDEIQIHFADETSRRLAGRRLDVETSRHIFWRDGEIKHLVVTFARASQ